MKCPNCMGDQKVKDGMVCGSCNYMFALNPKEKPYITDTAFRKIVDRLTGAEGHHFTYNQLYAQVYRLVKKKMGSRRFAAFGAIPFWLILSIGFGDLLISSFYLRLFIALAVAAVAGIVIYRWKPTVSDDLVRETMRKYDSVHPLDGMIKDERFKEIEPKSFDREVLKYAPERMLIVERNDLADMLLVNRFPMERKTLVVSAQRYPRRAFQVFQHFLKKYPDIPVAIMHDASREGLRLKEKLQGDEAWNLQDKEITDLGLFPADVDQLKEPIWRPAGRSMPGKAAVPPKGNAEEKIDAGFRVPVDSAPPRAMMGTVGMAMLMGMALLSPDLLAQQQQPSGTESSSGFG